MNKFLATAFFCIIASLALKGADDDSRLIYNEGFDRFDVGKPGCFNGKAEVMEEKGNKLVRLAGQCEVIPVNNFYFLGGTDYSFQTRFRFNDSKKIGGVVFTFNLNGKRKDFNYVSHALKIDKNVISVMSSPMQGEQNQNPNPVPALAFPDAGIQPLSEGRWYTLKVDVMPERTVVYSDIKKEGSMEKLMDFKCSFGTGRHTLSAGEGTDFDYVKAVALEKSSGNTGSETGESAVGPTNAADQAKEIEKND